MKNVDKKDTKKIKLTLAKETVRRLDNQQLKAVAGGVTLTWTCEPTDFCL